MENTPWWKSNTAVAVLGLTIPLATLIQGYLQKARENELQVNQQRQELRLAYMNVLVEGGLEGLALVADFAAQTERDEDIKTWAGAMKKNAEAQAKEERKKLEAQQQVVSKADAALEKAEVAQTRAEAARERAASDGAASDQGAQKAAEHALVEAEQARTVALEEEAKVRATRDALERSKVTLEGRGTALDPATSAGVLKDSRLRRTILSLRAVE